MQATSLLVDSDFTVRIPVFDLPSWCKTSVPFQNQAEGMALLKKAGIVGKALKNDRSYRVAPFDFDIIRVSSYSPRGEIVLQHKDFVVLK